MKEQFVSTKPSPVPFAMCFIESVDPSLYANALREADILTQSYDPKTQTSLTSPSFAKGTGLSYINTYSGLMGNRDDAKQNDT